MHHAPDFFGSVAAIRQAGFVRRGRSGAHFDDSGTVSVKLQDRDGRGGVILRRCSVVFEKTDNQASRAALTHTLANQPSPPEPGETGAIGQRTVTTWRLVSDGRRGRVIFVPHLSNRLLAGYYAEFPARTGTASASPPRSEG